MAVAGVPYSSTLSKLLHGVMVKPWTVKDAAPRSTPILFDASKMESWSKLSYLATVHVLEYSTTTSFSRLQWNASRRVASREGNRESSSPSIQFLLVQVEYSHHYTNSLAFGLDNSLAIDTRFLEVTITKSFGPAWTARQTLVMPLVHLDGPEANQIHYLPSKSASQTSTPGVLAVS